MLLADTASSRAGQSKREDERSHSSYACDVDRDLRADSTGAQARPVLPSARRLCMAATLRSELQFEETLQDW